MCTLSTSRFPAAVHFSVQANIDVVDVKRSGRNQKMNKIFEKYGM